MARPVVSAFTERVYGQIPAEYRADDERIDWPMLRFLAAVAETGGDVETLLDRIDWPLPEEADPLHASALVTPNNPGDVNHQADGSWLGWLTAVLGVPVPVGATEPELRSELALALSRRDTGTKGGITRAAQAMLTGTKTVRIFPDASRWRIYVATLEAETTFVVTWLELMAAAPRWKDRSGLTWSSLRVLPLMRAIEPQRPAGWRFDHIIDAPSTGPTVTF